MIVADHDIYRPTAESRQLQWSEDFMIRKLASNKYRLYLRKRNPKTGQRRNLRTFATRAVAQRLAPRDSFFDL